MENNLQTFTHDQFGEIRVRYDDNKNIEINLEDAARGLGFVMTRNERVTTSGDSYAAIRWNRVREYLADIGYTGEVSKDGYLPEFFFYMLAMKANNETALKFQRWIAYEVVPNIRKNGFYMTPAAAERFLTDPDFIIKMAQILKNEKAAREQAEIRAEAAEHKIAELAPKADYCDAALKSNETLTVKQIAQDYGMTPQRFNKLLEEFGVQFKNSGVWYLYEQYNARGWTISETYCFTRSDGTSGSKNPYRLDAKRQARALRPA